MRTDGVQPIGLRKIGSSKPDSLCYVQMLQTPDQGVLLIRGAEKVMEVLRMFAFFLHLNKSSKENTRMCNKTDETYRLAMHRSVGYGKISEGHALEEAVWWRITCDLFI